MPVAIADIRRHLRDFAWKPLFIDVLNWSNPTERPFTLLVGSERFTLTPVAEMGGMYVYVCSAASGEIPTSATRKLIENQVKERQYEHIILFEDGARQQVILQWMKRGQGAVRSREYPYTRGQKGDQLIHRLSGIAFDFSDLDKEGKIDIAKVVEKAAKSLDAESITKKFYTEFTHQRDAFQSFLRGIPATADDDARWYVSVMLNRLMFIYFVQSKGFLANDTGYLQHKLDWSKNNLGKGRYYHDFLRVLFFDGFAKEVSERSPEVQKLLGTIPYLNGGLFIPHPLEEKYGNSLDVTDEAFDKLFAFFSKWRWHLSERPGEHQNEIDPDVLGYIFEKYINQKQMGAYYTKEDITGYICRNTIIPRLFDKANLSIKPLKLPQTIRDYIYPTVTQRDYLPTETEREYQARQQRAAKLIADAEKGAIATINDAITANLNLEGMIFDLIPMLDAHAINRLYNALTTLSVLDPTCGSGAFLFAAIKILKPIYEQVLERMAILVERREAHGHPFKAILDAEQAHANRNYFITKSIVVRNLYGVDLMEEATEICKLRMFLRLVADLEDAEHIEPLPDVDFNIRAGNALVGYATLEDVGGGYRGGLTALPPRVQRLVDDVQGVQRDLSIYRDSQLQLNPSSATFRKARKDIRNRIAALNASFDNDMLMMKQIHGEPSGEYNTQPFHWFTAFYEILNNGGFDVIVGNPPYVEYSKIKGDRKKNGEERYKIHGYRTESCGNLYAFGMERAMQIIKDNGSFGMIVPLSSISTDRAIPLQKIFLNNSSDIYFSSFDVYPSKLFEGAKQRLTIFISNISKNKKSNIYSTSYNRWFGEERNSLLYNISYYNVSNLYKPGSVAKINTPLQYSIINKMNKTTLGKYIYDNEFEDNILYCHRIPYNFIKAIDFIPFFQSERDGIKKSEDYKIFSFKNKHIRDIVISSLNSNTFFWWWYIQSEGYHCGRSEIKSFPLGLDTMTTIIQNNLAMLSRKLMEDLQNKSRIKDAQYKTTGMVRYQEFYPRLSKPIIDEIDRVLAQHYGFTEEELDFIINYDIKYRMGRDAEDGDE